MNWEKGPRSVPGLYWLCRSKDEHTPQLVNLYHLECSGSDYWGISYLGTDEDRCDRGRDDWLWMGPIIPPESPY